MLKNVNDMIADIKIAKKNGQKIKLLKLFELIMYKISF